LLDRHVPRNLIDRPKQGFAIPLGEWLRGPLRDWAESLLQPALIQQQGYFRVAPIQEKWAQHLSGKRSWEHSLWPVLMFQAWLQHQGDTI
jgi:asparagine synthase (glutamine-hydrolysing)